MVLTSACITAPPTEVWCRDPEHACLQASVRVRTRTERDRDRGRKCPEETLRQNLVGLLIRHPTSEKHLCSAVSDVPLYHRWTSVGDTADSDEQRQFTTGGGDVVVYDTEDPTDDSIELCGTGWLSSERVGRTFRSDRSHCDTDDTAPQRLGVLGLRLVENNRVEIDNFAPHGSVLAPGVWTDSNTMWFA